MPVPPAFPRILADGGIGGDADQALRRGMEFPAQRRAVRLGEPYMADDPVAEKGAGPALRFIKELVGDDEIPAFQLFFQGAAGRNGDDVFHAKGFQRVDVRPRERHVVDPALDFDVAQEANDRGEFEAERHRTDLSVVVHRDDLDLPLAPQRDRLRPVHDLERLVRGVEEECLLHGSAFMITGPNLSCLERQTWKTSVLSELGR